MIRRKKNMFVIIFIIFVCLAAASCAILNQERFGKLPEGKRLDRIQNSPNYRDGEFKNLIPTRTLVEGQSTLKIIISNLFSGGERLRPEEPLPTVKTDLTGPDSVDRSENMLIWLGHSSFFIQLGGKTILVDPVFSDHGAPFSFLNKIFPGTDIYSPEDMPEIDYLLITHDHWDHLDYPTVTALQQKVKKVICPLGVGADFKYWGYPEDKILEQDWWDTGVRIENGLSISTVPARHYSGRLFDKNKTLWAGFALEVPGFKLFLSGDSGYGPHFSEIARTLGPFDMVAIDGGQYDPRWPLIHMTPEQAVRAAEDLGAKSMLLAHVGRFCISTHPWDEPFIRAVGACEYKNFRLLTPKMGEPVRLDNSSQKFPHWWENVDKERS